MADFSKHSTSQVSVSQKRVAENSSGITLAEFNQTLVPATSTDTSASQQSNPPQGTTNDKSNQSQNDESKQTENNQQSATENTQSSQQQAQTQYLYFGADEFLITVQAHENGWWYGFKDTNSNDPKDYKFGFFPSNFVQVIEKFENQMAFIPTEESKLASGDQAANISQETFQEPKPKTEKEKDSDNYDWIKYAHSALVSDQDLIIQARLKRLEEEKQSQQSNPEGIVGYKKIKIHESLSHAVNSSREGEVKTSLKAIKDQSPVSKAYRLMNHYFDYDAWVDQMNKNPPKKAKGDSTKKKPKKNSLNW